MLRSIISLLLLSSCSLGVKKSGGDQSYIYDVHSQYYAADLVKMAPSIVTTKQRNPTEGALDELFSKNQAPLKKIGIMIFDSSIQPSRSGLSGLDLVYLSAQGKQLLAEKLLKIWDESLPIVGTKTIQYIPVSKIQSAKSFLADGMNNNIYIRGKRDQMQPDDIFYIEKGKAIDTATILLPRGMRDFSLAMVPASELLQGPKFSEHAKHTVNALAKELGLDALLVIKNDLKWTAAQVDKRSGEILNEEATVGVEVTVAVPYSSYEQRLRNLGETRVFPQQTVSYRFYEAEIKIPVYLSVEKENQNFEHIQTELLNPVMKTYSDLVQMIQIQLINDLKKTHK